ncbi:helix-turn-helix domain-containing protein [Natronococcus sp. A-GB1]|uniref:helix-turn-helix domain-containing protein n=1 Tax=Natronococcus sp. A-GB1 TaxID=3037648 RepID=UPI00241C1135|nr:helix-turn-helix domain-containing protein [Natronococcus sp. A-GB1]MDG5759958.1 helix-turn-helix domain-containing protein [Natronococcus sp. A-GB1]
MSVIVEFSIATEEFVFGSALETVERMEIELEAIVPVGGQFIPYFWATGEGFEPFEHHVGSEPDIESITRIDRIDGTALYRAVWSSDADGLLGGLAEAEAVVLEAMTAEEGWYFRVRFPSNELVERFSEYCSDRSISIRVGRVHPLAEASRAGRRFELTPGQREAIVLAVQRGYFEVPRETDLTAIADELGISQQAASERVRRGANAVLRAALPFPRSE